MIYYVEDDRNIRDLVVYALTQTGYQAQGFENGAALSEALTRALPELILLDIMLPGEDGVAILRRLKTDPGTMAVPVVMLTAKGSEEDMVQGLDAGADDYLAKPFSVMELVARIKAVLRRSAAPGARAKVNCGGIELDPEGHAVHSGGRAVALTLKEYELLTFLMTHAGKAYDRERLLAEVWSIDYFGGSRTVDVHIQTLRAKLGAAGARIETIRGLGYRFRGDEP